MQAHNTVNTKCLSSSSFSTFCVEEKALSQNLHEDNTVTWDVKTNTRCSMIQSSMSKNTAFSIITWHLKIETAHKISLRQIVGELQDYTINIKLT